MDKRSHPELVAFPLYLVLYEIAVYLTTDAYLPGLPQLTQNLQISHSLAQLTLTTWFLGSASIQLFLGPISDRFGRRPILLIGGGIFLISTIMCAITSHIFILLIFRFLQGTAIPSIFVAGYAAVHELLNEKKAIQTLAWMNAISVLAPAVGPMLGAIIVFSAGWRWVFGILAIWATLTLIGLFKKMPETIISKNQHPLSLNKILRQYGKILFNYNYMRHLLAFGFLFGGMIAWITTAPFLIITQFHFNIFWFGFIQLLVFGSYISGTRFIKPLMIKYDTRYLVKIGICSTLIGGLLLLFINFILPFSLTGLVISMMLFAAGTGMSSPILNRKAISSSQEPMGCRVAIYSMFIGIFGIVGSILISRFYNGKIEPLAIILCSFAIISFFLIVILPNRKTDCVRQ